VECWQNQKAYNRVPFPTPLYTITEVQKCPLSGAKQSLFRLIFHNVGSAKPLWGVWKDPWIAARAVETNQRVAAPSLRHHWKGTCRVRRSA